MNEILNRYSPLALAFIGDAHYNLVVKKAAIEKEVKVNGMQNYAADYCSARRQARIAHHLLEQGIYTEEEAEIYKKGRNVKSHQAPKNTDILTYKASTGFEAVWGYWYLTGQQQRMEQIWNIIETIEE